MKATLITGLALTAMLFAFLIYGVVQTAFGSEVIRDENREPIGVSCNVSTNTVVTVGSSNDVEVLASSTRRAWAKVELVIDQIGLVATSSPFVDFSANTASTTAVGTQLGTSTPSVEFGLTTDFPYRGPVQVVLGTRGANASTSVRVIECTY